MSVTLNQLLSANAFLRIYGRPVSDMSPGQDFGLPSTKSVAGQFAQIRAFAFGSKCVELPIPLVLIVAGQGSDVDTDDPCGQPGERVWNVSPDEQTIIASFKKKTVFEALNDVSTQNISGGVTIENPRFEGGQICGTAHARYDIEVFGQHIRDDKRIPFCIPLEGCHTLYDFGIGTVQACLSAAPPSGVNICLKACVGKWGLSQCWDVCSYVAIARATNNPPTLPSPCDRK